MAGRIQKDSCISAASSRSQSTESGESEWEETNCETDLTDLTDLVDDSDADPVNSDGRAAISSNWLFSDNIRPPEYYQALVDEPDKSGDAQQQYSEGSTVLLDGIEDHWFRFARYIQRDPQKILQSLSLNILESFFDWRLSQRIGKGGRRLRGTKIKNSLSTYWKVFRLVYERATDKKISGEITRGMHKVLRKLAQKHGLKSQGREKACMYIEDLTEVLRTNLTTTEKRYQHGRLRIQLQLYLQLAGFTANRPGAVLELRYRHIRVSVLRDQKGGPNKILLEFTFEFTKSFLGVKDINTFPIPERMYDQSFTFSPHAILLGLIFNDRAFAAPSLTSPEKLSALQIEPGYNQLPLPLKPEMDDIPIFRRVIKKSNGFDISPSKPMTYSVLRSSMVRLGQITGFKQVTRPYVLRYGAGKAFNENGILVLIAAKGSVSEALQNLMMDHANIRTFQKNYLHRRVTADTAAIVREVEPQESVMRSACNMSRWIDPNRPWKLTGEQAESVNDDSVVRSLVERKMRLRQRASRRLKGSPTPNLEYNTLKRRIANEKARLRAALLKEIQERYESEQPVRVIERQLAGVKVKREPKTDSYFSNDTLPEQRRLIETMILRPPQPTLKEEAVRRNDAINAVIAYCEIQEGDMYGSRKRSGGRPKDISVTKEYTLSQSKVLERAKEVVFQKRPTICFVCLGNKTLPLNVRVYSYSRPGDLSKHFKRKHLLNIQEGESLECRLCKIPLVHKMDFQRHAVQVHGTVS
ncbi:MAG: hypothetical protein Q9165_008058 [Trypethelium subeluteriae]